MATHRTIVEEITAIQITAETPPTLEQVRDIASDAFERDGTFYIPQADPFINLRVPVDHWVYTVDAGAEDQIPVIKPPQVFADQYEVIEEGP